MLIRKLYTGQPELQEDILNSALAQFPIVGDQLGRPEGIQGSTSAVVVGALTALYGIIGLGQAAQNAVNVSWAIPRNSRLPIEVKHTFATSMDNQERVSVRVMEGDAPDPAACSLLGHCRITDLPPGLPKGSPIEVTYAFDESGRVRVRARDKTGGKMASIDIDRQGGLNDEQIDDFTALAGQYKVE